MSKSFYSSGSSSSIADPPPVQPPSSSAAWDDQRCRSGGFAPLAAASAAARSAMVVLVEFGGGNPIAHASLSTAPPTTLSRSLLAPSAAAFLLEASLSLLAMAFSYLTFSLAWTDLSSTTLFGPAPKRSSLTLFSVLSRISEKSNRHTAGAVSPLRPRKPAGVDVIWQPPLPLHLDNDIGQHVHGELLTGKEGIGVGEHPPKGAMGEKGIDPVHCPAEHEELGHHVCDVDAGNAEGQDPGHPVGGEEAPMDVRAGLHYVHQHSEAKDTS